LTRLIRDLVPFGGFIADLTEPLLTEIVNSAYPDNNPIPADPSQHRVATLLPSPDQVITAAQRIPGAIQEGLTDALDGDSAMVTTETTSIATDSDDLPGDKPLTNVVRDSKKAVPGEDPEPVGAEDNSENEALTETERNEQAPDETEPNDDTGTETDSGDESDDDESGDAEAA
jgi:hypothetical protein